MESFTPEQRQALQNAHQQVVQAAAQQVQQAQQELTERVAFLQSELDRARGARRTEAGMTGKPIPLNRTGNAKKYYFPNKMENSFFQSQMDE